MNNDFDIKKTVKLLIALDDEIEKKCFELNEKRKTAMLKRVFFLSCAFIPVLPIVNIFLGFSMITVLIPIFIFETASLVLLLPVILNADKGDIHAERIG